MRLDIEVRITVKYQGKRHDKNLPLLDAVEALQGRDGDKDDNSLLAVANLDLFQTKSQHASSRMTLGKYQSLDRSRPIPRRAVWYF